MNDTMKAIELTGVIDENHQLCFDDPLPIPEHTPVRVIVLYPSPGEIGEAEWLKAATQNPSFDFLKDKAEDIYSVTDGKPFHDEV